MRINKYLSHFFGLSRREADDLIVGGKVTVNGTLAVIGQQVTVEDDIAVQGHSSETNYKYVALNKPVGYVCSRKQQDSNPTIYSLLPEKLHDLKTVGRLDKDSSGIILLTNDGDFTQEMTHPKYVKVKVYILTLDREMSQEDLRLINEGVELKDGISRLDCKQVGNNSYEVRMSEGRNRQIRRTFGAIGYTIEKLKRISFGPYELADLKEGELKIVNKT